MPGVVAVRRQLRVDVEHDHAASALAVRVRDAVHPGVAAADHDHLLVPGGDLPAGPHLPERTALLPGDPSVALVEVIHREVDPLQIPARRVEVARDPGADRHHDRVVALGELAGVDVTSHVGVIDELDSLLLEDRDPPIDDALLELGVGHAEPHQPTRTLVALVDRDRVPALVELRRRRHPRRTAADHRNRLARAPVGRLGEHPSLLERPLGDRHLDLLDRDRVVVDREHAGRLARGGTDPPGELGEVVGQMELLRGLAPLVPVDEVVPLGNQVPERAPLVAERDPAVHAPGTLAPELLGRLKREVLLVVAHAVARIALVEADPVDLQERT